MLLLSFLLQVVEPRCQAWGELSLLGANEKILAASTAEAGKAPCERYLRAMALDDDVQVGALLGPLKDAAAPLGDWANLRLAEIEWRTHTVPGTSRPPSAEFNHGFMTKLYQYALGLPSEKLFNAITLEPAGPRRRWQLEVLAKVAVAAQDKPLDKPTWQERVQRELFVEYPDSPDAPLAFPKATLADLLRRAAVATDKHMNDDVLKTVAAAQTMNPSPEDACALQFYTGAAYRKLRKYKPAEDALTAAATNCPEGDFKKRAHFLLGQVQVIARSYSVAEPTMRRFAQLYKNDSLVDDALFNVAASADRAGDAPRAIALYDMVMHMQPPGDMCAEAAFRVAYGFYRQADYKQALDRLTKIGQGLCGSDDYERARAWYWESRTRAQLQQAQSAIDKPLRVILERQPLSYYAILARERLGGDTTPASEPSSQATAGLPPLPVQRPIVQRVLALSAQGLFREAQSELDTVLADASADEQAAFAPLLAEARDYHRAHMLFRSTLKGLLGPVPNAITTPAWRLAYPTPFAQQIHDAEVKEGLEDGFLLALIREESAFQLDAGSWANAYGLTQLIMDTALATARDMKLGYAPTADQLKEEPALAITLGAHHLAMLKRSRPRPPLILAAYNSGMGNVKKWIDARGEKPMDEFIEEIPLDETRGYVKRIMRTWATYRTLAGKPLPKLSLVAAGEKR